MLGASDLEALDGISLATDVGGKIIAVGATNWNSFAVENGAPELLDRSVIGRSLFEFVSGADVQAKLRDVMRQLSVGTQRAWIMPFRCDAPGCRRNMRQSITPIYSTVTCQGFLLQSIELDSSHRPPIDLFDFREVEKRAAESTNLPTVLMCSWCQRIKCEHIAGNDWTEAEDYYAAGGRSRVRISHGICEGCAETAMRSNKS
jgi:hypothetical protein